MKKKRDIYLHDIPLAQAWARFKSELVAAGLWKPLPGQNLAVSDALGRVTAEPVWAYLSAPHYHASAMDGYAVRSKETTGATETRPITLQLLEPDKDPKNMRDIALPVNTGHPLPIWADAVVMVEHTQLLDQHGYPLSGQEITAAAIEIRASVAPWQHVRPMGEDMVATELVLPSNYLLRPVDLGAVAGSGHAFVNVRRKPRVAIIPTGTELVTADSGADLKPGEIVEYNSIVLAAQVTLWGGEATRWPIVPDDLEAIRQAVWDAAKTHDLVLVNAGSSAGTEDYTATVVESLGELLVHGIAVRPGHPVILGMIERSEDGSTKTILVPVIGVPGYPVSAAITGELFVEPLLACWRGQPPEELPVIDAVITRNVLSRIGDDEFLRVTVGAVGGRIVATPIGRGAGAISSLVRADGLVKIPRFTERINAGEQVQVNLYHSPREIQNTIVIVGSHDMILDLMAQFIAERNPGLRVTSANVGSVGGLNAIQRREAHLGGSHLLDPETGEYNISYIKRYLPEIDVKLITLVEREQGFIIPRGNPAGIKDWNDLKRKDIRFVNRQRGAGTRVLLDFELNKRNIVADEINGYERQEFTHLAVAAAIESGIADYGLGIRAAANALKLGFVPLSFERYDLVIPQIYYESELIKPVLSLLSDNGFRNAVTAMPGYKVDLMGAQVEMD
ncbi:MAG: molybdopterin biosynthesis protein [Anaerolineales bacterium]|nr:molybdopterin biosynthesis protein [Anaerolineales bacterium]